MTRPNLSVTARGPSTPWRHRFDLLVALVERDIKLRYAKSVLGVGWGLLGPLAQLAVFTFAFRWIMHISVPHYVSFVFCGLVGWNWFLTSIQAATTSLVDGRGLVRLPGFAPAVLPAVSVLSNLIQYLLALPVLVALLLWDDLVVSWVSLLLPLILATQFLFTWGIAYFVAVGFVTFRDIQQIANLALTLLFYLTPVFYSSQAVPERFRHMFNLNPLAILLDAQRSVLISGAVPPLLPLLGLGLLSIAACLAGHTLLLRASRRFVEEL